MQTHNCKHTKGTYPMPKPPKMSPSPAAPQHQVRQRMKGKRVHQYSIWQGKKWFAGWGLFFLVFWVFFNHTCSSSTHLCPSRLIHTLATCKLPPYKDQLCYEKVQSLRQNYLFLSPKQAIISCTTMQV